jgi:hypothetical protein
MQATPLPPPIPLSGAMEIPVPTLAPPSIKPFEWEPVPIYIETVPPKPGSPSPARTEEDVPEEPDDSRVEENIKEEQSQPADIISEQSNTVTSGKPALPELPEEILAEVQTVEVPFIGIEVPVPRPEILVTATATAGISSVAAVGGTLAATTLFKQLQPLLKPVFKFALKKLAAIRKKPPPVTWARLRLKESRQRKQKRKGYVGQF